MNEHIHPFRSRDERVRDAYNLWINGGRRLREAADLMQVEPEEIIGELRKQQPVRYRVARMRAIALVASAVFAHRLDKMVSEIRRITKA